MNEIKGEELNDFVSLIDKTETKYLSKKLINYLSVYIDYNKDLSSKLIINVINYRPILDTVSAPMDDQTFNSIVKSIKNNGLIKEYPILLDNNWEIIDGRHRLKAYAIAVLEDVLGINYKSFNESEADLRDIKNVLGGTNFPLKRIEEDVPDLMIEYWVRNISENNKRPTNAIKAIIGYNTYKMHKNNGEKVKLKDFAFGCDEKEIGVIKFLEESYDGKYNWVIDELLKYKSIVIPCMRYSKDYKKKYKRSWIIIGRF